MSSESCRTASPLRASVFALVLCVAALGASGAHARDAEGRYTVKGAGLATCEKFLEVAKERGLQFYLFLGFVHGYLSASNAQAENTYDLVPWQHDGIILNGIARVCRQDPKRRFGEVMRLLEFSLQKQRLTEYSDKLQVPGEKIPPLYREVIFRLQSRLKALGHYTVEPTSQYDAATEAAMKAYQAAQKLPETGHADQETLRRLLYAQ